MPERVNYLAVPIELIACPFFSEKERQIITTILRLSDKFINLGGCNKTNKQLAFQHRTGAQTVSNAISKATKLGFIKDRLDLIHKKESKIHSNSFSTERKLQMHIPYEWEIMGDLYNYAFIYQDEEIAQIFEEIERELGDIDIAELEQEDVLIIILDNTHIKNFIGGGYKKLLTINKSISINKSIKKTTSKKIKKVQRDRKRLSPVKIKAIISEYNKISSSCNIPRVMKATEDRINKLRTRAKSFDLYNINDWIDIFSKIEESDFLQGDNDRNWTITFDWLITSDRNLSKLIEDNYRNKVRKKKKRGAAPIPGKYDNINEFEIINGKLRRNPNYKSNGGVDA